MQDYYKTLGVKKNASQKEIREAYRRLARENHPDINANNPKAERRFKDINAAYEVVGNEQRRKDYDQFGDNWKHADQIRNTRHGGGFGGFGGGGAGINIGDIIGSFGFSDIFGGGRRAAARQKVEGEVIVALEEVLAGAKRTVTVTSQDGQRQFEIPIPVGVADAERIVVRPKGLEITVVVKVKNHPRFKRHGRNLETVVEVPLKTALLGGVARVTTLDGKRLELKIPATTQNGKRIKLGGKGLPGRSGTARGDLIAVVDVRLPAALSEQGARFAQSLEEA